MLMSNQYQCSMYSLRLLLLVVAIMYDAILVMGQTACSVADPICRCTYDTNNELRVDCDGTGQDLLEVPPGIPDDTVILVLNDHSIEAIGADDFTNLVNLRELYLVNNVIRSELIHQDAFKNLQNLELLDLNGNRISLEAAYANQFRFLQQLKHLDLGSNGIATIDAAFVHLFDQLDYLYLISNSLVCDCDLLWFKNWLINKQITSFVVSGAQCYTPESVQRQTIREAPFCIPVQRCYFCDQASTNGACNFATQLCSGANSVCQNTVRLNNGEFRITKACEQLDACLLSAQANQNECNSGTENSVCRYCCQGNLCNRPESAILNGYQFPFPNVLATTGPSSQAPTSTTSLLLPTTPSLTTPFVNITTNPPPTTPTLPLPTTKPLPSTHASTNTQSPSTNQPPATTHPSTVPPVLSTSPLDPSTPSRTTAAPLETFCPVEITQGETGLFSWPRTSAGDSAMVPCVYDAQAGPATRKCDQSPDRLEAAWQEPDTRRCPTASMILQDIANVTIGSENAVNVSEALADVTSVPDVLKPNDVTNAVSTFENLARALSVYANDNQEVFGNVLDSIDKLTRVPSPQLLASQTNDDSASRLVRSIDEFNLGVRFSSDLLVAETPSVDVIVFDIDDHMDNGLLFFGSGQPNGNAQPHLITNSSANNQGTVPNETTTSPDEIVKGSLFMPNSLLESVGDELKRCQFVMYEKTTFFDIIQESNRNRTQASQQESGDDGIQTTDTTTSGMNGGSNSTNSSVVNDCISTSCRLDYTTVINSVVISGSVGNLNIHDLDEPVTVTFKKFRMDADNPRCVFWKEEGNDGRGGWSNDGCYQSLDNSDDNNIVCKCNHLTNFAMLMDVYSGDPIPEGHQLVLSIISYAGCCISLIGLVLTLITYTCCGSNSRSKATTGKNIRGDKRAKVLVNFVISLILVNLFFIAGSLTAEFKDYLIDELCTAMAICLHFSLLAAMAWMAVQAFNLYMALVKVFEVYYSHFILKIMLGGWGIPLVIVGVTIGVDLQNYGSTNDICWLSGISFYVAFLVPICLVLIFNTFVFVTVTWKLCHLRKSKISQSNRFDLGAQLRASASITFLLGLTWVLGFFAIGEASLTFNYLFATFNSLQGFSVFVFQCLLQPDIRKRWVMVCCPSCSSEPYDSKSGAFSTSTRNRTNMVKQGNNNTGKTINTVSSSYTENPTYGYSEG
ncbi:adhesion G-protein coupled receptor G6-like isoform X2 [Asterias amurensis]|uniref:adhesion G-protein coupled receptor G6-like isoform X2 n=1 Tax=Asterias amurensis TaxID=7602 RepID=UPI003AB29222